MRNSRLSRITVAVVLLGFCCCAEVLNAEHKTYTVKPNDTLSGIAQAHGLTVSTLLRSNTGTKANRIFPGQILRIPIPASSKPEPKATIHSEFRKKLDQIQVERRKWKHIVIHHSATDVGNARAMDRYHREERHMENGLAYHFVIGNGKGMGEGEVVAGPRWLEQIKGGHLASDDLNENSIGICLIGNFDSDKPTKKQLESLRLLIFYLLERCDLKPSAVKTHQEINTVYTRCPGIKFPKSFLKELNMTSR